MKDFWICQNHNLIRGPKEKCEVHSTIEKIKNLIKIHKDSTEGCTDAYFTGMQNGMIVILSCLEGTEPEFEPVEKED